MKTIDSCQRGILYTGPKAPGVLCLFKSFSPPFPWILCSLPPSGSAFRLITSEGLICMECRWSQRTYLYSRRIPFTGLSGLSYLHTWLVFYLKSAFQCKISQSHCHFGAEQPREGKCPIWGTLQTTPSSESPLLWKRKPCSTKGERKRHLLSTYTMPGPGFHSLLHEE